MIGGSYFVGLVKSKDLSVFQSINIIEHKTFHRYTTRPKQGGSQSRSDIAKGNLNTAGTKLRRYNENALEADIRKLLLKWKNYMNSAHLIYIKPNSSKNQGILVG